MATENDQLVPREPSENAAVANSGNAPENVSAFNFNN